MSALTKTFVVLLCVMSLLSAAGFIVFVNRAENFKQSLAGYQGQLAQSQANLTASKAQVSSLQTQADAARRDVDAAEAQINTLTNANTAALAARDATIANDQSQARIMTVTQDNLTAALTASEGQRKSLSDTVTAGRAESDRIAKVLSDDELALSSLTQRNDVSERKLALALEDLAQAKADNDRISAAYKEIGGNPNATPTGAITGRSAPSINGVVRDTRPINGIPYATISVGSAEDVQKGMVFNVIDRVHGKFLGELTIDSVDLHAATGKLEGPAIGDIRVGTDVRTQL